jgi:methylglyoxal synthase
MKKYDIIFSADASKKGELIKIIRKYRFGLSALQIAATESTALYTKLLTGLSVNSLADGMEGGYLQIARYVENHEAEMVIFLFDPLSMRLDEPGVQILLKSCFIYNVPLANNMATAEFILERYLEKQLVVQNRFSQLSQSPKLQRV